MHRVASLCFAVLLLTAGCTGVNPTPPSPTPTADDPVTPTLRSPGPTPTPSAADGATPSDTLASGSPGPTQPPSAAGGATPSATPASGSPGSMTVTVTKVVDGDTLDIRYPNGSQDTVRLLGVDTPEVHIATSPEEWEGVPDSDAGHECLRTHGDEASEHVTQWLTGESVRLAFDENEGRRGYYGRLLAYVYHDGEHVNYQLVAEGYGRVYDSSFTKRDRFYDGEATAQTQRLGAWSCRTLAGSTPTTTQGSEGAGGLAVATVHADAAGNDHENENDEYVVFENTGDGPIDLSGWTVSDEADHTYTVPQGFSLEAGATVTLYTGSGQDTTDALYWGSDSAIWNNGGDTIYVSDDAGSFRIEYSYSG